MGHYGCRFSCLLVAIPLAAGCSKQPTSTEQVAATRVSAAHLKASAAPSGPNVTAQLSSAGSVVLSLKAPAYQLVDRRDGWQEIHAPDCMPTGQAGQPLLPHQMIEVLLPPDAQPESVSVQVRDVSRTVEPGSYRLPAAQGLRRMDDTTPRVVTAPVDPARPLPVARVASTGQMRRWNLAHLDFAPFHYETATGKVTVVTAATAEITFTRSGTLGPAVALADAPMDRLVASRAVNFSMAASWYPVTKLVAGAAGVPTATADQVTASPTCPASDPWTYVIVTTNEIKAAHSAQLNAFAAHKESIRGQYVKIITQDDYGSLTGPAPNGRAEKIRQWLMNNWITHSIEYVLLIGNPFPDRLTTDPVYGGESTTSPQMSVPMKTCYINPADTDPTWPTDSYYADMNGNWNKGGSATMACEYWGDYKDPIHQSDPNPDDALPYPDGVDLLPDLIVGRISVYDVNDTTLDSILQKLVNYQTATTIAWRKNVLMAADFLGENADGANWTESLWNGFLSTAGFSRTTMYQQGSVACATPPPANPSYKDDSVFPSTSELLAGNSFHDQWVAGNWGIVAMYAHGGWDGMAVGWGVGQPSDPNYTNCWTGGMIGSSQFAAPQDDTHPTFTYQLSCDTGQPEFANNLQYAILRLGGISTVAATRVLFVDIPNSNGTNVNDEAASGIGFNYLHGLTISNETAGLSLAEAKWATGLPNGPGGLAQKLDLNLLGDPEVGIGDSSATSPGPGPYCSSHGKCSSGTCMCQAGYSGPDCSVTCPGGPTCSGHGTCNNGACTCQAGYTGPSCSINCGTSGTCPDGNACNNSAQCGSRVCMGGICKAPSCAPHCNPGTGCGANADCGSNLCTNSICANPSCAPNCGPGAACGMNADCSSRVCTNNLCAAPSCSPHCNPGAACGANTDCGSKVCTNWICANPACAPNCGPGAACGMNADCSSRVCTNYLCAAPSCSPNCNQGASCGVNNDCRSLVCTGGLCKPPVCSPNCNAGARCGTNNDCKSHVCKSNNTCQ